MGPEARGCPDTPDSKLMRRFIVPTLFLTAFAGAAVAWSGRASDTQAQPTTVQRVQPASAAADAVIETPDRLYLAGNQAVGRGSSHAVRSVLNVDRALQHGDFVWNESNVSEGPVWVRIDLSRQLISVFRDGHEIGTAVILYGAEHKKTPRGVFPIITKIKDHRSSLYDAEMPYTMRLTGDGIAIHGSNVRWGGATHGCIGVPTEFAAKIFGQAKVGDEVVIL